MISEHATTILFRTIQIEQTAKIAIFIICGLLIIFFYIHDRIQKEHAILRNYPLIGHFRYIFESMRDYVQQYFITNDREELPFNRAVRSWVYRAAKNVENVVGFGSTRDFTKPGTLVFTDAPFPPIGREAVAAKPITIGPYCRTPYIAKTFFNISAMSYGALSKAAILALSNGARMAGCWLNTGEGGISPYHLEGGADIVAQIGTAKYGYRDLDGNLDDTRLKNYGDNPQIKMFEIKLSQGAKPGKGGLLPAAKVTPEIAEIRGIAPYKDSVSPNRHEDISNVTELLNVINRVRDVTGKPTGFKAVFGSYEWLDDLFNEILKRGIESAPDFITLDSKDGGTGAAPMVLVDHVGLPIRDSLPVLVNMLVQYGLKERIKVIVSGKLATPSYVAWGLCMGADFVNCARGFLFALGCIQAMRCHLNTCPTGITTHNPRLVSGLDPKNKAIRVYHYATNMVHEIGILCHSVGVLDPRELNRTHARVLTTSGHFVSLADLFPLPEKS